MGVPYLISESEYFTPITRIRERYLIPNVGMILGERPREPVFASPPLLWIEILSPEDQPERWLRRCA